VEPPSKRQLKLLPRSPRHDETDGIVQALEARIEALERRNRSLEARHHSAQLGIRASQSEERYRTILDSEPACVKLVSEDGSLLSMNPAGLKMIEADSEADIIGLCVFDLVRPEDRARFIAMHRRVLAGESASLEFEIEGLRGTKRHMETFAAPLYGDDGQVTAQLAVTNDITVRKQEQAELAVYRDHLERLVAERTLQLEASREEARRIERLASLGTFAAGVAHEINNPLGTILLGAELIEISEDRSSIDAAVNGIRRDVARCQEIVKGMRRFGRGETSRKIPTSINAVVCSARDHSRKALAERRLQLDVELAEDLPAIAGNETELSRVLVNLIQNAALASQPGGRIRVQTEASEQEIFCTVQDFGCGMSPHVSSRARDPFFTTRLNQGGTGLGLSLSHGIICDHQGSLEIDSCEGIGTSIRIRLPRLESPSDRNGPGRRM
jgi:PAS domain S-box-containing protein